MRRINNLEMWISAITALALWTGCGRSPQAKEGDYLKRARAQLEKRDFARALLEFQNAARVMPADPEPHYQLGLAYLQTVNYPMAVREFRKTIQLNPKHEAAQLKLAQLMTASRNRDFVQQAATSLERLLATSSENAEAIDTLAIAEFQLGKPEDAVKRLQETLRKFPNHLASAVTLARMKVAQSDLTGAEAVLKEAVASAPQSSEAVLALGQLYLLMKQPGNAETQVRRALQLEPKNPAALLSLAVIQTAGNRLDEADQTYRQLAALPDRSLRSLHAIFLYRTGKKDLALAEFERLAKSDPDDRGARSRLFAAYLERGKLAEAQAVLTAALKRNPKDTEALLQRSELSLKSGAVSDAERDVKDVLRLQPDSAEAHFILARVCQAEMLYKNQQQELNESLRLKPDFLQARLALARNYIQQNQPQAALDVLDRAPQTQRNAAGVVVNRNWALLRAGRYDEVRAALNESAGDNVAIPELQLQNTVLKLQQKDYAGAKEAAEDVLKGHPEDASAAQLLVDAYIGEKNFPKGLARLAEIVAAHPRSAPLQEVLGQAYLNAGNLTEARKAFESAKKTDLKSSAADLALVEIDRRENHNEAAQQRLNAIVKAESHNQAALSMLAALTAETGDQVSAIAQYRSVLVLNSSNVFALNNLAYLLATRSPDEALKYAQQAAELEPENAAVEDTLGWIYYQKGIYRAAVDCLKIAVSSDPTPRRQFHLAMSYLKAGDRALGEKVLQAALRSDPDLPKKEQGW